MDKKNKPKKEMHDPDSFNFLVYKGSKSKMIAQQLENSINLSIFSEKKSFGLDKNECIFLFDKNTKRRKGVMTNQSLKNKQEYPYSIAIHKSKSERSIINQIKSDYFTNFNRNVSRWGFPWGDVKKSFKNRDYFNTLSNSNDLLVKELCVKLKKFGLLTLDKQSADLLINWLNKSKNHESNVFVMVCPDYSFSYDSNNNALRYDNKNTLRDGIGLVAIKSLEFIRVFNELITKYQLKIKFTVGIADYEDTKENLARLKETKNSFDEKIKKSMGKIQSECDRAKINAKVIAIREFFGSKNWISEWKKSENIIKRTLKNMKKGEIKRLILNRRKLYSKWFPKITDTEVINRMISQGTEYTNCGFLFNKNFSNLLILGTNSINMEFYYRLRSPDLPILYVSKIHL